MGVTGLEQAANMPEKQGVTVQGGAKSGAPADDDPELAELNAAWPTLPAGMKAGILAMVRASKGG
jgi:hypothetical protein